MTWRVLVMLLTVALLGQPAGAGPLDGRKTLKLVEQSGRSHPVATIEFSGTGTARSYKISWHDRKFGDHFLSMRPFKCLEGTAKYWCRVPYPYKIRRQVSTDDLVDLEYDTLFI